MYNNYQYGQLGQIGIPNYNNFNQAFRPSPQMYLQGKQVESLDVVRTVDIPLDGTISYFPLTDGSAIITKQLLSNGTSKIRVYKEIIEDTPVVKYVTEADLDGITKDIASLRADIDVLRGGKDEQSDAINK